jgi:hypothetical protein
MNHAIGLRPRVLAATATTMLSPIHQKKIAIIMVSHSRYKSREGNKSPPPGHIAAQPTNVRFRGANRTLSGHPPKAESDPKPT